MEVSILGCRGSYPVASSDVLRYGGDTTCVQIQADGQFILLDAGTGIRHVHGLPDGVGAVHMFITHLHWDHIIGFPLFPALQRPDITLHIYSLERSHDRFYAALQQSMSRPLVGREWNDMVVNFQFHELSPGAVVALTNDLYVTCALANHPYRALGYRVQHGAQALAFIPDTAPFDRYLFEDDIVFKETPLTPNERAQLETRYEAILALTESADWLIYDAALTPAEYEALPHWGHSTMPQAVAMARAAEVGELIFFHHNPTRTDEQIDALLAEQRAAHPDLYLAAAYAGMRLGGNGLRHED
ncbi:MAG: MBL fold metallo-hydrolase [Anaerolineales bacterium]